MSVWGEAAKLPAFMRRDLKIAVSYRMGAAVGVLGLAAQAFVFSFIGKLVDPSRLPTFGGTRTTYLEFVAIGICLNMVVLLLLHQVATAIRTEQLIGTLESLLVTPTRIGTVQAGSAAFDLLYVPLRLGVFLALIALLFGLDFHAGGVLPAVAVLVALLPFLWGLGLLSAGAILTFRRGLGALTVGGTLLGLSSGAFFPLSLLPQWVQAAARVNPLAISIRALRETLIGGAGWGAVRSPVLELIPLSAVAIAVGAIAFRCALARERRRGTLGLY